jgi:hypothetical protein
VRNCSFEWHEDDPIENPYATVLLDGLEPGQCYLHFVQESGWGFFEYTVCHGGGAVGLPTVSASGFLLACSLILGLALIFLGAASLLRRWA